MEAGDITGIILGLFMLALWTLIVRKVRMLAGELKESKAFWTMIGIVMPIPAYLILLHQLNRKKRKSVSGVSE